MKKAGRIALFLAAFVFAVVPLLSQTTPSKSTFEVVSVKPTAPNLGIRGGGPRGDTFSMTGVTLKNLLQVGYQRLNSSGVPMGQLQVIGGPNWIDSERYDVQAKADCSNGAIAREQMQAMIQSMLEERFQLKAHVETRELPVYNLVVAKDGPKLKLSADQTAPAITAGGPPQLCRPAPALPALPPPPGPGQRGGPPDLASMPRGAMMMMMSPTGITMQAAAAPRSRLINVLQQMAGRPVIDKTGLKGLYDIKLQFSPEGLAFPAPGGPQLGPGPAGGGGPGAPAGPAAATDPVPSLFTAIQELGLRLDSTKAPVEVLVVDSAQKPTEN